MAVLGGIILWIVMLGLIAGYFIIKKYGDKKEADFKVFVEERKSEGISSEDPYSKSAEGSN